MAASLTPDRARRRMIQLVNYEDGLWDILLGLIFLALSVFPVTRRLLGPFWNMVLFLLVLAILVIGLTVVRRVVSMPRLGRARMRRTPQKAVLTVLLAVTVIATMGLVVLTLLYPQGTSGLISASLPVWAGDLFVDVVVAVVIVAVFSLMGYLFGVPRLFLYGWLIGLGNLASTALTLSAGIVFNLPLAAASIIILAFGGVLLARFMRKYPIVAAENLE
ncbi:MAG TPA: hypothetical protein VFI11_15770 [Anaerolineales bacterium]|nr:hypothetical protein [Anaerolineales bacterium]